MPWWLQYLLEKIVEWGWKAVFGAGGVVGALGAAIGLARGLLAEQIFALLVVGLAGGAALGAVAVFIADRLLSRRAAVAPAAQGETQPSVTVSFGSPRQTASEPHLKWWHVPVSATRRLEDCKVFLLWEGRHRELRWSSWKGPTEYWTLRPSEDPRPVPVVVRSEIPTAFNGQSLEPAAARITDVPFFVGDVRNYATLPPGLHEVRFRLESAGLRWDSPPYRVAVPHAPTNSLFEMHQLSEGDSVLEPPDPIKSVGLEAHWRANYLKSEQRITPVDWTALDGLDHRVVSCDWKLIPVVPDAMKQLIHDVAQVDDHVRANLTRLDRQTIELAQRFAAAVREGIAITHRSIGPDPFFRADVAFKAAEEARNAFIEHVRTIRAQYQGR